MYVRSFPQPAIAQAYFQIVHSAEVQHMNLGTKQTAKDATDAKTTANSTPPRPESSARRPGPGICQKCVKQLKLFFASPINPGVNNPCFQLSFRGLDGERVLVLISSEVAEMLLDVGAVNLLHVPDAAGDTPIALAMRKKNRYLVRLNFARSP